MHPTIIAIPRIAITNTDSFILIAGPCVVENEQMPINIARAILQITHKLGIPFVFKASYKKANRTRSDSFTTIGDRKALEIIAEVGRELHVPTLSDIHSEAEAELAAQYVDILQIPAFLCRQTDLLITAAKTGKVVNIKKGQFVSGAAMHFAVEKVRGAGNNKVMTTERGSMFGYNDLVVDFRNIPLMQQSGVPVILDVTHSLQQPNLQQGVSGGQPAMISTIARAGIAAGADGIFIETHPNPASALSDGANMLPLAELENLLVKLVDIRKVL